MIGTTHCCQIRGNADCDTTYKFLNRCEYEHGMPITSLETILDSIRNHLKGLGETVAVAESVTAGNLQAALSLPSEASSFFQGGITAYNLGQKTRHLGVDPISASQCNCVSEMMAQQMAKAVLPMFCSHWGIGVTGYASAVPELGVDDIFHAYYAIAHLGQVVLSKRVELRKMPMRAAQKRYVEAILMDFDQCMEQRKRLITKVL
jgi:nicotinamide-nucleotide amidase